MSEAELTQTMDLTQMREQAGDVADILRVVAHPERLMVVCQLTAGEVGVRELQKDSTLSQSAFSQHLSVLRKHNIIRARKEAQQVYYQLADERMRQLIQSLHGIFCSNNQSK